jgi:hypothetical protein
MAVLPISTLKTNMPIGVAGSITASDMHDLVDTIADRTSQQVITATASYTAMESHNRRTFVFDSPEPVSLFLPNTLPVGWSCKVIQRGVGVVTMTPGDGASIIGTPQHGRTGFQGALCELVVISNTGSAAQIYLGGQTQTGGLAVPRVNLATLSDVYGNWDANDATTRTPSDSTLITALADRSAANRDLTAAAVGTNVSVVLDDPAYIQTTGGNNQRRLDATNFPDNMFASGGYFAIAVRSSSLGGMLISKWATTGWVLNCPNATEMELQYFYGDGSQSGRYWFTFPLSATDWKILEIEWNSDAANVPPVIRINGTVVVLQSDVPGAAAVDDSPGELAVGNRNQGAMNTPFTGDIGEILALGSIPTNQQKSDIVLDMQYRWGGGSPPAQTPLEPIDLSQYTLVFNEDFTAPLSRRVPGDASTDANLWDTSMGGGTIRWMGNTPERQIYVEPEYAGTKGTPLGINPFSVANSVLTITCANVSAEDAPYLSGKEFTSGLITTAATYSKLYGYFEMRARMTDVGVTAAWPAFWLLFHSTGPSEFDIVEAYGVTPSMVYQTTHQATDEGTIDVPVNWTVGWHTYGLKWTAEELVYYVDGQPTGRIPNNTFTPGYIIANLALEGRADRVPDPSDFPIHMEIDWIRVYDPI